jgi:hypothetical protein
MLFRSLLAAAALLFAVPSAHAAFDFGDLICESSTTTGTGTLNLAGALTNYVTFASQITSASVVPYHIVASDGTLEVGYGVYTDAGTDTMTRVANWSSDGSGAELTLPAGTHSVCVGPNTQMYNGFKGMQFYNNDAGAVGAILPLWHDSTSAADGDIAGEVQIWGGADDEEIGQLRMEVNDGATTSEDTEWQFVTRVAGADLTALTLSGTGISTAAHIFAFGAAASAAIEITSTDAGAAGPTVQIYANSASPAAADTVGIYSAYGEDDGGGTQVYGSMSVAISDVAAGTEDGTVRILPTIAGTATTAAKFGDTGLMRFHEAVANGANFKALTTAAANTADTTCTFEDDANFIPDSCVGDGSDASDERIKTDLKPAGDAGAVLDKIKIYDYAWTVDAPEASEAVRKGKRGLGPVAQELFNVNADFVEVGGDDPVKDPWTWKPERVVPYLIVEVQNLRKQIANSTCYGIKLGNACIGVSM